jgi:starch synthase
MHIVMLAAENGAWPGGKVGGLGDVMRDLPKALAELGHKVSVITPGYGLFIDQPTAEPVYTLQAEFSGQTESAELLRLPATLPGLNGYVIEHPLLFANGKGHIYTHDDQGPYATDSHRFALFSALAAQLLLSDFLSSVSVVHCHDWHLGAFFLLRQFSQQHQSLKQIRTVFSVHNLSLQGIRPYRGHSSAPSSWFPGLEISHAETADPVHTDCINLMRSCIKLADAVNTVSPGYALEITRPSNWQQGMAGGDGLEKDLAKLADSGQLLGILNGCDYGDPEVKPCPYPVLWGQIEAALDNWVGAQHDAAVHYHALKRLQKLARRRRPINTLLVSIGRLTFQKLGLLVQPFRNSSVMAELLQSVAAHNGVFILLGDGDPDYDRFFLDGMKNHDNFLYLRGYSEALAAQLYANADLFVMPSVFEPCGISQMLAMRSGTPCLVHATGGLADTIVNGVNGFSFGGDDLGAKIGNLLAASDAALSLQADEPDQWELLSRAAAGARFSWATSANRYTRDLYGGNQSPG